MNLKNILAILTILAPFYIYGQKNYLEVGFGRGFLSSGDGRSWSFSNEYKREIGKGKFLWGIGTSGHYAFGDDIGVNFSGNSIPFTIVDKNETYPFSGFIPGSPFSRQSGIILDTKTRQDLYLNLDVFLSYRLSKTESMSKWDVLLSIGPTLNYTSQIYTAQTTDGFFESSFSGTNYVRLVVPYYKRQLVFGGHFKMDILREISKKSAVGISGRVFNNVNADSVFSYALLWRVNF